MEVLANFLETLMIVSFGISWPINVMKSYRGRTAKGKSVLFNYLILFGYISGVAAKIIANNYNLSFYFYFPNILMVIVDIALYYRNKKLDSVRSEII